MTTPSDFRRQRDYWDSNLDPDNLGRAAHGAQPAGDDPFYLTPDQRYALERLGPPAGRVVLDLGAGLGTNALYLASRGATVVAADISPARLRRLAASQGPGSPGRLLPVVCRAEALPFRRGAFDGQYTKSVLIHTKLHQSAPELARTLAPAGRGVFVEPFSRNPLVNLYRATNAPKDWIGITRYFDESAVADLAAPFATLERRPYYLSGFLAFFWQFAVRSPLLFRFCLAVLGGLDRFLFTVIPPLRRLAWFEVMVLADPKFAKPGPVR